MGAAAAPFPRPEAGAPAQRYSELAHLVEAEGITLWWAPRGERPRQLRPDRAHRQYVRLSAPPQTQDRTLTVNGVLYRVIAEPTDERRGTVGIRLHSWSTRLPGRQQRVRVIAAYTSSDVEVKIKEGLIGEPVEAVLIIRYPVPGTSIDPDRFEVLLQDIRPGPPEDSRLGTSMLEDLEDE